MIYNWKNPCIPILVGDLEPWNLMTFHSVGNVIIPTDFHFFSDGLKPE